MLDIKLKLDCNRTINIIDIIIIKF